MEVFVNLSDFELVQNALSHGHVVPRLIVSPLFFRVAKMALAETYENSGHYDITYTLFVWIAFLPTCTTPGLFASWRMSRLVTACVLSVRHVCVIGVSKRKSNNRCGN